MFINVTSINIARGNKEEGRKKGRSEEGREGDEEINNSASYRVDSKLACISIKHAM